MSDMLSKLSFSFSLLGVTVLLCAVAILRFFMDLVGESM